jgi:CheY-like chemotaxis protein
MDSATAGAEARGVVLVVEDEVIVRMGIAQELRGYGFSVVEAHNADEAIEIIEARKHIDVVFSDIHMPGSMNGADLAAWLRKHQPRLPVLLTSGVVNGLLSMEVPAEVSHHILQKPYDMDMLADILNALVMRSQLAASKPC